MFNSLQVTVGEYIVHSLKGSNALIEIKLHRTQCLSSVRWEIICKAPVSCVIINSDRWTTALTTEPLPRCVSPPSAVGEPKMMVFPH